MEKKGNRSFPNSVRVVTTDSKKNQDAVISKIWSRNGKRRETSCSGTISTSKTEPSRKPQPQRAKSSGDKRPKTRSSYYTSRNETSSLKENERDELFESVFSPDRKKQNLNHLLNFSYAPREVCHDRKYEKMTASKLMNTMKHKYNKEHFLQAKCRFIVNYSGDYKQYINNPDALVDWNLVEQVNLQVYEPPNCPICLYPPMAAKITRCGHIYCWSCILHYLALSDKTSRKCPICYEAVSKIDLKSVMVIPQETFNIHEKITLKLMKKQRGCLTAYPADAEMKNEGVLFSMSEKDVNDVYSKLVTANMENIMLIVDREYNELQAQMGENQDCPEKCFIEQAMELLNSRRNKVLKSRLSEYSLDQSNTNAMEHPICLVEESLANIHLDVSESDIQDDNSNIEVVPEQADLLKRKLHYFYQASDGQHIYLHALNARMLEHTYGSLEFSPKIITGKILEKESGSVTEDLRKRLRYLQHLPLTCQFEVAEIELGEPVVSQDTLGFFHDQIEIRKKKRQRKAKEEKRREKRIDSEKSILGKYSILELPLESSVHFPKWDFDSNFNIESRSTLGLASDLALESTPEVSVNAVIQGPSFATMLAAEKKSSSLSSRLKPSTFQPSTTPVIGTKNVKKLINGYTDSESEYYEPPDLNLSLSDALTQALTIYETEDKKSSLSLKQNKNKKNKKKILFTTNMAYTGN